MLSEAFNHRPASSAVFVIVFNVLDLKWQLAGTAVIFTFIVLCCYSCTVKLKTNKQTSKQKAKKIYVCSADLGLLKGFKGPSLKSSVGVLILEAVWKHSNQTVKGGPY